MDIFKKMFKTSSIYFVGRVLSGCISFFLLPIYTNKIAVSNYGYYDLVSSILTVSISVVCLEMWGGILRFSFNSSDLTFKSKVYSTGFIMLNISLVLYICFIFVAYFYLDIRNIFLFILFGVTLAYSLTYGMIARSKGANYVYALSGLWSSIINALSGIIAVYIFHLQLEALFISVILGYIAQIIIIQFKLKVHADLKLKYFDKHLFREMFFYSLPLAVNSIVYYIQNNANKLIIENKLGMEEVGIFSVISKYMSIVTLLASIFHLAWQETAFSISNSLNKKEVYQNGLTVFSRLTSVAIVLSLPLIKVTFKYLIGLGYSQAENLIPFFYFSLFLLTMNGFLTNLLTAEKKTNLLFWGKSVGCILNLGGMFIFTQKYGLISVALCLVLGNAAEFLVLVLVLRKLINFKVDLSSIYFYIVFYVITAAIYLLGNTMGNLIWFVLLAIFCMFYLRKYLSVISGFIKPKNK